MWADNGRSAAVARRIGMREVGVLDDPWYGTEEDPTSRVFRHDAPTSDQMPDPSQSAAELAAGDARLLALAAERVAARGGR